MTAQRLSIKVPFLKKIILVVDVLFGLYSMLPGYAIEGLLTVDKDMDFFL